MKKDDQKQFANKIGISDLSTSEATVRNFRTVQIKVVNFDHFKPIEFDGFRKRFKYGESAII